MGFVLKCLNPFCGLSDLRKTAIFFAQFKNIWIISIVCVSKMINFQHTISHGKIIFASQTFEFVTVLCCVKKLSCKSNLHEVRRKHLWLLSASNYYKKKYLLYLFTWIKLYWCYNLFHVTRTIIRQLNWNLICF